MKKVVVFHHVSNLGGGTISLVDVCQMLSSSYEVVAVIPRKNSEQLTERLQPFARVKHFEGVMPQISYYSGSNALISRGFFSSFCVPAAAVREIVDSIAEEDPDIILANSMIQCRMGKYLKHLRAKKLIYVRETFREGLVSRHMIRLINRYFDGVLCISPYEKDYARFALPCEVITDCYVPTAETSPSQDQSHFTVLFLGGDARIKGLDILLRSIEHVQCADVRYAVCGHIGSFVGTWKNRLLHPLEMRRLKRIQTLLARHRDKVTLHGFVSNTAQMIVDSDVVVFPSTVPHQARPALEAGEFNRPVILSDFPQTAAFMKHEYNCLTFRPNDPKALARAIDRLAGDPLLAQALGEKNHQVNVEYHDFSHERERFMQFISQVLEGKTQ